MKNKYRIVWDGAYTRIELIENERRNEEFMSFSEAKKEVRQYAKNRIQDYTILLQQTIKLKPCKNYKDS